MHRQRRQFPLIPDGESCLQEPISMRLYENEDLITNIRGPYQDKDYNDFFLNHDFLSAKPHKRKQAPDLSLIHIFLLARIVSFASTI